MRDRILPAALAEAPPVWMAMVSGPSRWLDMKVISPALPWSERLTRTPRSMAAFMTAWFTPLSLVAATTSNAPFRSSGRKPRSCTSTPGGSPVWSICGAIITTSAPASASSFARRTPTAPPPTITHRRPRTVSMIGSSAVGSSITPVYNDPMPDLWQQQRDEKLSRAQPLAARMRPRKLDEFAGQQHFLGQGKLLRRMLEADQLTSVLFYGPPGTGKTTLAELIAGYTQRHFDRGNAAAVGVKDVRHVLDQARKRLEHEGKRTIFFLDEIHRFNRAQQDVLLGDVERGIVTLIGATTENPFFAVNNALVSRSQIFQFEPLSEEDIAGLIKRAIADEERGYGQLRVTIDDEAIQHWATMCDGDARRALAALEIAVLSEQRTSDTANHQRAIHINLNTAEQSIQQKAIAYDRDGDAHHDAISAYIKSVRGSDPDAAIYWLAKMLHAGEDPMFIARRIAILASEDIGNADPRAISVASSCYEIVHRIGLPEARITLAQATTYLATAPKSNASYAAINQAMSDVKTGRTVPVPRHLRSGAYAGAKELGNATVYQYAHNSETGYVEQTYLGVDKTYYQPVDRGYEKRIREYLAWIESQREKP
eukprot:g14217.t1